MPRWARFLACTFSGVLLSLSGFLVTAYWWEGGARFWVELVEFLTRAEFRSLIWLFALLVAATLLISRSAVSLYGMADGLAGVLAGLAVGAVYVAFLVSSHAADWGGFAHSVQRAWPSGALFTAPLALSGGFTAWLWDRLE